MHHRAVILFATVLLTAAVQAQITLGGGLNKTTATAPAPAAAPEITATPQWTQTTLQPGAQARCVLQFALNEGFHVNANKPLEEFLIGTSLKIADTPLLTPQSIQFPAPLEIELASNPGQPLAVYETTFNIGLTATIAPDAPEGDHTLNATLRYQACNDQQCFPPKNLEITIPLTIASAPAPEDPAVVAKTNWTDTPNTETLAPTSNPSDPSDPTDPTDRSNRSGKSAPSTQSASSASSAVTPASPSSPQDWRALAEDFKIANRASYSSTPDFLQFIHDAESGTGATTDNKLAGKSIVAIIAIIFLGGLALNLTPCVLPLIPINIAIIGAGARAGSRTRGFLLGAAYGLGIALVYGALGLVVVLGLSNAFGALNATLWFNLTIVVLFLLMALAMFDIISIDFSRFQAKIGIRKNENGSFLIAVAMGALSALLAGACVAPAVIVTLAYAQDQYARGVHLALLLPFLLGLGMALPWPFAGAGLSFLPKPGGWMLHVKKVMGLFILALAVYYAHASYVIYENRPQTLTQEEQTALDSSLKQADEHGWIHSLEEGLAQAKAANKPVLLDFWATWCKNCLIMNKTTLQDEAVLKALDGYVKIKYQAEDPAAGQVKDFWEYYELKGLPTYLILQPK